MQQLQDSPLQAQQAERHFKQQLAALPALKPKQAEPDNPFGLQHRITDEPGALPSLPVLALSTAQCLQRATAQHAKTSLQSISDCEAEELLPRCEGPVGTIVTSAPNLPYLVEVVTCAMSYLRVKPPRSWCPEATRCRQ